MIQADSVIELLKDKYGHLRPKFKELYRQLRHFHYSAQELEIVDKRIRQVLREEEAVKAERAAKRKQKTATLTK